MKQTSLTYFTLLSVAAHAALFAVAGSDTSLPRPETDNQVEIGLVTLVNLDRQFSHEQPLPGTNQSKPAPSPSPPPTHEKPASEKNERVRNIVSSELAERNTDEILTENPDREKDAAQTDPVQAEDKSVPQDSGALLTATEAAPMQALNAAPRYPEKALRYGWEGEVWLQVDVSADGTVDAMRVDKSSGYPVLDQAALRAVRNWQFEPARVGERATRGSVLVPVQFRIRRS